MTIGILAYGSLLDDPGRELAARADESTTPAFSVEFAEGLNRDGGPTLIPVDDGGARVTASILVLKDSVDEGFARDMLFRRETRKVGTGLPARRRAPVRLIPRLRSPALTYASTRRSSPTFA